MIRSLKNICLLLAFSLAMGVIWPDCSMAVQAPQLELLGEIKSGLRVPTRIDVDNSGNLFVADARNQVVVKYNPYGVIVGRYEVPGMSGDGLAVNGAGSKVFVSAHDHVACLQVENLQLSTLGRGAGEFISAGFIDIDQQGYIYVADVGATEVKIYTPGGDFFKSIKGQFKSISSIAVETKYDEDAGNDEIYIADSFVTSSSLPSLYVYSAAGGLLRTLSGKNSFYSPVRIFGKPTFDDVGRFYIGDVEQNNLQVMALASSPLQVGTPLVSPLGTSGDLLSPVDLAYDKTTGRLFALYGDSCIKIYGVDGAENPVAVNDPPEAPVPVSPIGGSEVATVLPSLSFNNSVDADETDELSYTIRVFAADNTLVTSLTVAEQAQVTTVAIDIDLQENDVYRWQVQAFDGQAESAWSELQSFYVNAVQEAPTAPVLVAPLAELAATTDTVLEWQGAIDADPFDTVSYRLEVSAGVDFDEILYGEELTATERQLTDWSEKIEPGQVYHWQVTAIDNHGLKTSSSSAGSFIYQASMLNVSANMPGAQVYLGGHQGYAGQFIGEAPFKLRDLPEGRYQLVVERAGFEPFYQPVDIQVAAPTVVYAELRPALLPNKQVFDPLKVAGKKIKSGSRVTPLVADLDLDGIEDLLLSYVDGGLHYHPGVLAKQKKGKVKARKVRFDSEKQLSLPQIAGGTPVLVDWNNDYQQDLLIGTAEGSVWLYLNQGDFSFTEEPLWLAADSSSAVPAVADIDADGDKDLVVGSGDGELVLFSNSGTDVAVQLSEPQLITVFAEAVAPTFADWNGDGQRELMMAAEGQIYQAVYTAGALTEMKQVAVKGGASIARLIAHDLDDSSGKNLIVGTADGRLLLSHSRKDDKRYVADFYRAVEVKLKQLEEALEEDNSELLPLLEPLYVKLAKQKMKRLAKRLDVLVAELPADSKSTSIASELVNILSF